MLNIMSKEDIKKAIDEKYPKGVRYNWFDYAEGKHYIGSCCKYEDYDELIQYLVNKLGL